MSKFDVSLFYSDDLNYIAFSKEKYTKEQAIEQARKEIFPEHPVMMSPDFTVRWQAQGSVDGKPYVGWYLMPEKLKRCCEVWAFPYIHNKWDIELAEQFGFERVVEV